MPITREEAHKFVDTMFDTIAGENNEGPVEAVEEDRKESVMDTVEAKDEELIPRVLPEGKRAVRTDSSGDRVYLLDENKKTRQWITNPQILDGLGFEQTDVVKVEDNELLKYQMGPALYKLPENA